MRTDSQADRVPGEADEVGAAPRVPWRWLSPLIIVLVGLALYVPGLRWGLPAVSSWSQDTIAGLRTMIPMQGWPERWVGRYPPLHYFLNYVLYQPVYAHWRANGQIEVDPRTKVPVPKPPQAERVGLLILMSRWLTVVMACGAGIGVWLAARRLTGDELVALLAPATLMLGAAYTCFAHLGNVDVPTVFWFALSAWFYARVIWGGGVLDCALLGLFAGLAVSTKDGTAGMYPGMAVILLIMEYQRQRVHHSASTAVQRALLQPKWAAGALAAVVPFFVINGMFAGLEAYRGRVEQLATEVQTLHYRSYDSQLGLLMGTVRYAASAVGWPMVLAIAASVVHTLRRHRTVALAVLVPCISYYVFFIVPVYYVYARFLFPPLALLGILVALAGRDLLVSKRAPAWMRYLAVLLVLLPTVGYAATIDWAMIVDTRYRAEAWFRENVPPEANVGAFSKPQYLPRLQELGYATYAVEMTGEAFERPQPEYLVLTSYNYEDFDDEQKAVMQDLLNGDLGYELEVTFRGEVLGTGGVWLGIAGWGVEPPGKIAPTIIVLRARPPLDEQ